MHEFFGNLSRIINSGKSRSVLLTGNVYDLFYDGSSFVPLVDFLISKYSVIPNSSRKGIIQVLYEVNRRVRIVGDSDEIRNAWNGHYPVSSQTFQTRMGHTYTVDVPKEKTSKNNPNDFDKLLAETGDNATFALEFLRKITEIARSKELSHNLVVVIEGVDMLVPNQPIASMNFADRKRVAILHDWFSDPSFFNGHDTVIGIAESRSQVHDLITKLPQVLSVQVPNPNQMERTKYAELVGKTPPPFLAQSAGLSIHAYRQLLFDQEVKIEDVVAKVEQYIVSLVGEDVVEFKRPTHTLDDAIGYDATKQILKKEILDRINNSQGDGIPGMLIAGPIGGGKTYLIEGLAGMANMPVMVLKNFRSQWFGQTDVMVERIKRAIYAIIQDGGRLLLLVDEADTAFGGLGQDTHETERRSTGKIQGLMSDPALRGKAIWLLMTARPHLLSPDMRREGRAGEMVIPILDPSDYGDEEQRAFIKWMIPDYLTDVAFSADQMKMYIQRTKDWSAGKFRSVRYRMHRERVECFDDVLSVIDDTLSPNIGDARRYQKLQSLLNTSRKSFIPKNIKYDPDGWSKELRELESKGHR